MDFILFCDSLAIDNQSASRWLWLLKSLGKSPLQLLMLESLRMKTLLSVSFVRTPWSAPRTTWSFSVAMFSIVSASWSGGCAPIRQRWIVLCDADLKAMQLCDLVKSCYGSPSCELLIGFTEFGFDSGLLILVRKLQLVMGERLLPVPPDHLRMKSRLKPFDKPRLRLIRLTTD